MLFIFAMSLLAALAALSEAEFVPLWGRWNRQFEGEGSPEPETELTVELTAPNGKQHTVSGFWDGGSSWGARFMPYEAGVWTYRTRSNPGVGGLDGQSGAFECGRAESHNRFLRHGPVKTSDNGRHFEHEDGSPFFWLGDTVWTGPQLAAKGDWDRFLDNRVDKRFTAIQFVLTAPWRTALADENGNASFSGREKMTINPAYFQRMDERVDAINEKGLLAIPVMLWAIGANDPGRYLPEDQGIRLAKYLLARYGAHHLLWILPGDDHYSGENTEKWKRIGRAVFEGVEHAPVTLHPQGMHWPFDAFREEKWMGYYGYQSGHGDDADTVKWIHSGPPSQVWREEPHRPIINLEPPYEGHVAYQSKQRHSPYSVRRACYWSLLNAPTAGLTYGGHGVWSWHSKPGESPTDHEGTGTADPWETAMDLPGSFEMAQLRDFFASVDWWKLSPDQSVLAEQPGGDDPYRFVSAARSENGEVIVVYLPVGGEVGLAGGLMTDAVRADWFDPRTGEWQTAQPFAGDRFRAPDDQDWLLLFRETDIR